MELDHTNYSIEELLTLRKNKMLAANAEYQRGEVWSPGQQKRLIDSILRGYPIPLIYLHHIKTSVAGMQREDLEIIDGQQRINALYEFSEGAFRLYDPIKDEREARLPSFLKSIPCPWAGCDFGALSDDLRTQFRQTKLAVVKITTPNPNEARDLFIRLQAGLPLNAQEKRDAWPGSFTEMVLRFGGKEGVARYPGHDFFKKIMRSKGGGKRGEVRQLCAQMFMLFFARRKSQGESLTDINAREIDDFYYQHLDLDLTSSDVIRFTIILDQLTALLGDGKRRPLKGHEVFHLMMLVDALLDDYLPSWRDKLAGAFDAFMKQLAIDSKTKWDAIPGAYWSQYGVLTRANSDRAQTIRRRHQFFLTKMFESMGQPVSKDSKRLFGPLEREIVYYRDGKRCAVCDGDVGWAEGEIHHVQEHSKGGPTTLENGVLVHAQCHPQSDAQTKALAAKLAERRKEIGATTSNQ